MQKISLLGSIEEREPILSYLQQRGLVQLIDTQVAGPNEEEESAQDRGTSGKVATVEASSAGASSTGGSSTGALPAAVQEEEANLDQERQRWSDLYDRSNALIQELRRRYKDKYSFSSDYETIQAFFHRIPKEEEAVAALEQGEDLLAQEEKILMKRNQNQEFFRSLEAWRPYEVDLSNLQTESTASLVARIDQEDRWELLQANLAEGLDFPYHLEVLGQTQSDRGETSTFFMATSLKGDFPYLMDVIRKSPAVIPDPRHHAGPAKKILDQVQGDLAAWDQELARIDEGLQALAKKSADLMGLADYARIREARSEAAQQVDRSIYAFSLQGWVPAEAGPDLKEELEKRFTVYVDLQDVPRDADYPVALKNGPFSRLFETILRGFSAPNTQEWDPTPAVSLFACTFFGMMLSDVGYGILLTLLCWYLLKKKPLRGEGLAMAKMFVATGVSSIIWGFVFGGFFGDLVTSITNGQYRFPCLWFDPMSDPMLLMIWSMIFGVIHLFAGMAINMANLIHRGKVWDAILDNVPWFMIIGGVGVMLLAGSSMQPSLPAAWKPFGSYAAMAGAVVILLTGGRDKKNIFGKIFGGITSLYNISSFVGDIFSYTRILALVLSTSVLALVVNQLCVMVGSHGIARVLAYLTIGVLGHLMNFLLSALSAYVHSSRLQYVEFFGRFFESGGKFFKPLQLETKYTPLEEVEHRYPQ